MMSENKIKNRRARTRDGITTVPMNHLETERWSGFLRNFKVNRPNTHIATVNTQNNELGRIRVQQLWNAGTGELLWTHKHQESSNLMTMFPNFSPDGRYVGFFDGQHRIILLDV